MKNWERIIERRLYGRTIWFMPDRGMADAIFAGATTMEKQGKTGLCIALNNINSMHTFLQMMWDEPNYIVLYV